MRKSDLAVLALAPLFAIAVSELALALDPWSKGNHVSAPAQGVLAAVALGAGWLVGEWRHRLGSRAARGERDG